MKFIKSKLLQKAKGKKKGKYLITLEVTDYDLEMLEDLTLTYSPFKYYDELDSLDLEQAKELEKLEFTDKYRKWLLKIWKQFWKLWKYYDE